MPFGGLNPTHIMKPKWGTPNPKKIGYREFVSSTLSDVENFAEFSEIIFLNPSKNDGDVASKLGPMAYREAIK